MTNNRFCVFCGKAPVEKNREHVLPLWLLELTGNPKRVVNFGTNYKNGETIRFDWSSFVVPSCESCNTKYSKIEERAKGYVESILQRDALTSVEYIELMDWLDKVRVGVWIAYHFIQGNPTSIEPNFHINTRISKKDRMVAIYALATDEKGLNALGVESLIFHSSPSCFGLKINNILIVNMSSDYLFSARCGFPYPQNCKTWLDGENAYMLSLSDFDISRRIKHPLIRKKILKPSIHLYQPIMISDSGDQFQSGFMGDYSSFDSFIAKHTLPPYPTGKGILFIQYLDKVEPIYDMGAPIYFQNVTGVHSRPLHELIRQIYEFQIHIYENSNINANSPEMIKLHNERKRTLLKFNKRIISHYKDMGKRVTKCSIGRGKAS